MNAQSQNQLKEKLRWANSYTRAEILLNHCPMFRSGRVVGTEWFEILGEEWSCCDNIGAFRWEFRRILLKATHRQLQAMMTEEERQQWRNLPDHIEAFRGCEADDDDGLSFSLSKSTAAGFPFLNRYRATNPALVTATIPKHRAVLKLCRDEDEIITPLASIIRREVLTEEAA